MLGALRNMIGMPIFSLISRSLFFCFVLWAISPNYEHWDLSFKKKVEYYPDWTEEGSRMTNEILGEFFDNPVKK